MCLIFYQAALLSRFTQVQLVKISGTLKISFQPLKVIAETGLQITSVADVLKDDALRITRINREFQSIRLVRKADAPEVFRDSQRTCLSGAAAFRKLLAA